MEHAAKALGAVAAWLGPAVAVWATDNSWIAFAFLGSTLATFVWFQGENGTTRKD